MFTKISRSSLARLAFKKNTAAEIQRVFAAGAFNARVMTATARTYSTQQTAASTTSGATPAMFCFQCEQTKDHTGCTTIGNCGKTPEVAALQDLSIHAMKGLSTYAVALRNVAGDAAVPEEINKFTLRVIFSTLTNVNFDANRFKEYLYQIDSYKNSLKKAYEDACAAKGVPAETFNTAEASWSVGNATLPELIEQGKLFAGVLKRKAEHGNATVTGLQEMITYGLKGLCAYAEHAEILGQEDLAVYKFVHECLYYLTTAEAHDANSLVGMAMKTGTVNLRVLELLDNGENARFGTPVPTQARITPVPGKCILVSGHDLQDLEDILKLTEGTGINVYTHGELLPAHGYPELKKYKHLVGNYGGAWQLQKIEFSNFPGSIVVTTNCLIEPRKSYAGRIFTHGAVGWEGVPHIQNRDFTPAVEAALKCEGFTEEDCEGEEKFITVGFSHRTIISVADKVIEAVKSGDIKRFFVIGGCDGAESERNYYKRLADTLPKDAVILTLGCGKYRFNKQEFGTIGNSGIPRLLDMGQCNDAYGAVQVAVALANAFKTDVNSLPLSLAISWFEQKAVAVLLSLLSLGIRNIRIGPALPAFATPEMLQLLNQKFNLLPIGEPSKDLESMMKGF